jgi:hypothetical protein
MVDSIEFRIGVTLAKENTMIAFLLVLIAAHSIWVNLVIGATIIRFLTITLASIVIVYRLIGKDESIRIALKLASTVFGYALELIGKRAARPHWEYLGHYLSGKGTMMTIPLDAMKMLLRQYLKTDWSTDRAKNKRYFEVPQRNEFETWNNSIGKTRHAIVGNILSFVDYYKFYAYRESTINELGWYNQTDEKDTGSLSRDKTFSSIGILLPLGKIDSMLGAEFGMYYPLRKWFEHTIRNWVVENDFGKSSDYGNGFNYAVKLDSGLFASWSMVKKERWQHLLKITLGSTDTEVFFDLSDALFEPFGKSFLTRGRIELTPAQLRNELESRLSDRERNISDATIVGEEIEPSDYDESDDSDEVDDIEFPAWLKIGKGDSMVVS